MGIRYERKNDAMPIYLKTVMRLDTAIATRMGRSAAKNLINKRKLNNLHDSLANAESLPTMTTKMLLTTVITLTAKDEMTSTLGNSMMKYERILRPKLYEGCVSGS